MDAPDLSHVDARLARGQRLADELSTAIDEWYSDSPHGTTGQMEDGLLAIRAHVTKTPPLDWSLSASDAVADFRFALDYTVYSVAMAATQCDPPPGAGNLAFPIVRQQQDWEKVVARKLLNVPPDVVAIIGGFQPFAEGNGGDTSWLVLLDDLCNTSKHRLLPLTLANLHTTDFRMAWDGLPPKRLHAEKVDAIEEGTLIARIEPEALQEVGALHLSIRLHTYVAFAPGPPAYRAPVKETLPMLAASTAHVRDSVAAAYGLPSFDEGHH